MSVAVSSDRLRALLASQFNELFEVSESPTSSFVATPILGPDNTELWVEMIDAGNGKYRITDAGSAQEFLFLNGVSDEAILQRGSIVARDFGFSFENGELATVVESEQVARAIIDVAQAMLKLESTRWTTDPRFTG